MFFSELVSFFSEVRFCFGHYIVPFSVGAESSTREHSRTVQQSLGAGLKVDFFFFSTVICGSSQKTGQPLRLWHPAQCRLTAPTLALPPLTGHFYFLHVSSISHLQFITCCRPAAPFSGLCFLGVGISGLRAQVPCYEQAWVGRRVSLRKWAERRSPVLTLVVFYI